MWFVVLTSVVSSGLFGLFMRIVFFFACWHSPFGWYVFTIFVGLSLSVSTCMSFIHIFSTFARIYRQWLACMWLFEWNLPMIVCGSVYQFFHFPTWIGYHESPLVLARYRGLESPIAWNIWNFIVNYHPLWLAWPWLNPLRGLRRHFFPLAPHSAASASSASLCFHAKLPAKLAFVPYPGPQVLSRSKDHLATFFIWQSFIYMPIHII